MVDGLPVPDPTLLTTEALHREIRHVRELYDREFVLIERQRVESKRDNEKALDAALLAQKDAASVLATGFTTAMEGVRGEIADLKERLGKSESARVVVTVGLVLSLVTIAALVATFIH